MHVLGPTVHLTENSSHGLAALDAQRIAYKQGQKDRTGLDLPTSLHRYHAWHVSNHALRILGHSGAGDCSDPLINTNISRSLQLSKKKNSKHPDLGFIKKNSSSASDNVYKLTNTSRTRPGNGDWQIPENFSADLAARTNRDQFESRIRISDVCGEIVRVDV